jgi:hypothetical protein
MLVATINPPAKKVVQATPFSTTELTANQMCIKCTSVVIGGASGSNSERISFDIRFGTVEYQKNPDGTNGNAIFNILLIHSASFTQSELASWGTDDTVIFNIIAQKLGFSIVTLQDYPTLNYTN